MRVPSPVKGILKSSRREDSPSRQLDKDTESSARKRSMSRSLAKGLKSPMRDRPQVHEIQKNQGIYMPVR